MEALRASRAEAAEHTVEAMRAGADVIYQAAFLQFRWPIADLRLPKAEGETFPELSASEPTHPLPRGGTDKSFARDDCGRDTRDPIWYGRADFLRRVEKPSALGDWSYEVVETKLARSTKARAIIQLCFYSELVGEIQGVLPDYMHVVLGGGAQPEKFPVQRYLAYFRKIRRDFEEGYAANAATYPEPVEHCRICAWTTVCDAQWRKDDYLSLVANITRNQRKVLVENRIATVADLGALTLPREPKMEGVGDRALLTIHEQARLQVQGRTEGRHIYDLLAPPEAEKGLCSLPPPSAGDMFLDFEGDAFATEQGLEYLFGVVTLDDDMHQLHGRTRKARRCRSS